MDEPTSAGVRRKVFDEKYMQSLPFLRPHQEILDDQAAGITAKMAKP